MKFFYGAFAYFFVGGLIFGFVFSEIQKECPNRKFNDQEFAVAVSTWPAWLAASLFVHSESGELSCKTVSKAEKEETP